MPEVFGAREWILDLYRADGNLIKQLETIADVIVSEAHEIEEHLFVDSFFATNPGPSST